MTPAPADFYATALQVILVALLVLAVETQVLRRVIRRADRRVVDRRRLDRIWDTAKFVLILAFALLLGSAVRACLDGLRTGSASPSAEAFVYWFTLVLASSAGAILAFSLVRHPLPDDRDLEDP